MSLGGRGLGRLEMRCGRGVGVKAYLGEGGDCVRFGGW